LVRLVGQLSNCQEPLKNVGGSPSKNVGLEWGEAG
jgi:hypothetical protein